jgi:hypothetical protein
MFFNFGSFIVLRDGSFKYVNLIYGPCPCQRLYRFKAESLLLQYLKDHCNTFSENPEGEYSLNYILFNLIYHWDSKHLITHGERVYLTKETKPLLDPDGPYNKWYFELRFLRRTIANLHFTKRYRPEGTPLFWCCPEQKRLIRKILRTNYLDCFTYKNKCKHEAEEMYQLQT